MFSATFPPNMDRLAKKYLNHPQRIMIDATIQAPPKINQEVVKTSQGEKFPELLEQLNKREGSVIIFTRTKRGADDLTRELQEYGHKADAIHGDLSQARRDRVIRSFRNNVHRILVATDIAARGLDIPHIMHVINYDLPQCPEDYIHRIGRTGRAGAEGNALSLILPKDSGKWREISRMMNPGQEISRGPVSSEPSSSSERRFPNKKRRPNGSFFSKGRQKRFR